MVHTKKLFGPKCDLHYINLSQKNFEHPVILKVLQITWAYKVCPYDGMSLEMKAGDRLPCSTCQIL